jgi:hypothetical protein
MPIGLSYPNTAGEDTHKFVKFPSDDFDVDTATMTVVARVGHEEGAPLRTHGGHRHLASMPDSNCEVQYLKQNPAQ